MERSAVTEAACSFTELLAPEMTASETGLVSSQHLLTRGLRQREQSGVLICAKD